MEFIQRYWAQIRVYLEGLSVAEKWLVASLLAILLLGGSWLLFWASQPNRVPIEGFADARGGEVLSRLRGAGIDAEQDGGRIMVPTGRRDDALSLLAQGDLLRADTSEAFAALIERQSPWQTDRQNEQAYILAKQRVLGQIIGKMREVDSADVIVSMPQQTGFAQTHHRPSASVTVWPRGSGRLGDDMVDSVARLVAGSVAEMRPEDVSVTDGNHGRTRTVADSDDLLPTETLEVVQHLESYHRQKIEGMLGYIPGVMVAVNVQVDPVARREEEAFDYEENEPLRSEDIEEIIRRDIVEGGEPGPQSNVGLDIAGGGGSGREEELMRQRSEFGEKPLVLRSHTMHAGHQVQQINASINVPRGFFAEIYRRNNPDAEAEPTDEQLQPLMEEHLARIQAQVEPLMLAEAEGVVQAHMIPDDSLGRMQPAATAGWEQLVVGPVGRVVGLGALALLSLGLMLLMVRKASQQEEAPSVEELSGMPPWGEEPEETYVAGEDGEEALAGLEVNENDMRSRQIADQISDLIKGNPDEAGHVLGRWMRQGD